MTTKISPIKARRPRGFSDRSGAEIRANEAMIARIRRVYERYGFEPVETPLIEYSDALGKFLPDQDRPNEGVFSFQDEDGQEARSGPAATGKGEWLSLRYDLTAPLARYVAENYERLPKPYRSYRWGWVLRNEKPGPGRFRQFMQFDADTVGASSPAADAEMCMMAADTMEEIGIPRGQYVIKVNSRKVLDGVMDAIRVQDAHQRLVILRAIDKYDRLGIEGVRLLLGQGRKDESGDFTKGAGLDASQVDALEQMLSFRVEVETLADGSEKSRLIGKLARRFPDITSKAFDAALDELGRISRLVEAAGYDDRVVLDASVVRGLEYYTGPVFEADLTFEIKDDEGRPVRFGSVGGGGRYDGLIGRFMDEAIPATGFSLGVSRLQAALAALGTGDHGERAGPVVVLVMDRDRIGDYRAMVAALHRADVPAEVYLGEAGMRAQMKYADRRNAPLAIIQGEDEKRRGVVQIKDLALGKKLSAGVADNKEWREERPGQEEVAEADLVEAVNRLLGRGERRPP
ncbi:MAG: histidine--tRNA ligase [Bauldia sp.]